MDAKTLKRIKRKVIKKYSGVIRNRSAYFKKLAKFACSFSMRLAPGESIDVLCVNFGDKIRRKDYIEEIDIGGGLVLTGLNESRLNAVVKKSENKILRSVYKMLIKCDLYINPSVCLKVEWLEDINMYRLIVSYPLLELGVSSGM